MKRAMGMGKMAGAALKNFTDMAKELMGETAPRRDSAPVYMQREPIGVYALVTPWNVPLTMSVVKLAAALATGNTCVL